MASRGGQPGNKNGSKNKVWADAIRRYAGRNADALDRLAERVFKMAEEGDLQAMKEIGDRLDGKAHQSASVDVTVEDGRVDAPPVAKSYEEWLERHRVEPAAGTATTRH